MSIYGLRATRPHGNSPKGISPKCMHLNWIYEICHFMYVWVLTHVTFLILSWTDWHMSHFSWAQGTRTWSTTSIHIWWKHSLRSVNSCHCHTFHLSILILSLKSTRKKLWYNHYKSWPATLHQHDLEIHSGLVCHVSLRRVICTNNDVEGWHHCLNQKVKKGQLPFYLLVHLLHEETKWINIQVHLVLENKITCHE